MVRGGVLEAPSLPGELTVDEDAVDAAVAQLNQIHDTRKLELALALGSCVIDTFFGGDLEAFRRRGKGHQTFQALAQRGDLKPTYRFLLTSVAVLAQFEQMPSEVGRSLSLTHHKLLLPLEEPADKAALATTAVEKGLSTRELEREVRRIHPPASRPPSRGPKPLHPLLREMRQITRDVRSMAVHAQQYEPLEATQADEVLQGIDDIVGQLEDLRGLVDGLSSSRGARK